MRQREDKLVAVAADVVGCGGCGVVVVLALVPALALALVPVLSLVVEASPPPIVVSHGDTWKSTSHTVASRGLSRG